MELELELVPVRQERTELEQIVHSFQILDKETHDKACLLEKDIEKQIKWFQGKFEEPKGSAYDSWKKIVAWEKEEIDPLTRIKVILKTKIGTWRQVEQKKRDAEAWARLAAAKKAQEELQLAQAVQLEEAGDTARAEAVLARPVVVTAVAVAAPKLEKSGVRVTETWSCEVDNLAELISWVAEDLTNRFQFLAPNESALNAMARSQKTGFNVPGCRASSRFS